jgi:hypothetical protein
MDMVWQASLREDKSARGSKTANLHAQDRMIPMKTIVLYGNSLVVSSIGASLQSCPDVQVLTVDATLPGADQRLSSLQPEIVVFDLAETRPELMIRLWKSQTHLSLIGVDLAESQALVLSGRPARILTLHDLLQVITSQADDNSILNGRPDPAVFHTEEGF